MRSADTAICARVASSKLLYLTVKNKVSCVVSSYFGEVLRFYRQQIKLRETVDVPEVVDDINGIKYNFSSRRKQLSTLLNVLNTHE